MSGRKNKHLSEVIHHKLGLLLYREASDPRFQAVTITSVRLSADYSLARVNFSCFLAKMDPQELAATLNKAAGFFGRALGRTLTSRRTPRLEFFYDPGFDYATEMDRLLKETKTEQAANTDE